MTYIILIDEYLYNKWSEVKWSEVDCGGVDLFIKNQAEQLVMLGPILLTIGKNIQMEVYVGWLT
jgi:hypothetical protein